MNEARDDPSWKSQSGAVVKDPVCHMDVVPAQAAGRHEHGGEVYYFCNTSCLEKFRADPEKYLPGGEPVPHPAVPVVVAVPGARYTCPMDPEVVQEGPGSCPKCGMALEPMTVTMDEANPELEQMSRRFWIGLLFSVPLVLVAVSVIYGFMRDGGGAPESPPAVPQRKLNLCQGR